jgi:hypothetical protein
VTSYNLRMSIETITRIWIAVAFLTGSALVILAIAYWALSADSLPSWLPGHKPESHPFHDDRHKRHGLAAFVLGVIDLSGAYLFSRDRRAR